MGPFKTPANVKIVSINCFKNHYRVMGINKWVTIKTVPVPRHKSVMMTNYSYGRTLTSQKHYDDRFGTPPPLFFTLFRTLVCSLFKESVWKLTAQF